MMRSDKDWYVPNSNNGSWEKLSSSPPFTKLPAYTIVIALRSLCLQTRCVVKLLLRLALPRIASFSWEEYAKSIKKSESNRSANIQIMMWHNSFSFPPILILNYVARGTMHIIYLQIQHDSRWMSSLQPLDFLELSLQSSGDQVGLNMNEPKGTTAQAMSESI